jgi:hypothetical protein
MSLPKANQRLQPNPFGKEVRHMVVPDTQVRPGVKIDHMRWAGLYAASKHVDRIIHLGDHWDMASLSCYDKGKRGFEGRRYKKDIEAGNAAMRLFMEPVLEEMQRTPEWKPTFTFTLGNHEQRIWRAVEDDPQLEGLMSYDDLDLSGWHAEDYLEVAQLDGVCYSHFFVSGVLGRPVSSAKALVTKRHRSCVMGHVQKAEIDVQYDATGRRLTGIFAGCFNQHDEMYLGPQVNAATWKGLWILYNCKDGEFTFNNIPLAFLKDRYRGQ